MFKFLSILALSVVMALPLSAQPQRTTVAMPCEKAQATILATLFGADISTSEVTRHVLKTEWTDVKMGSGIMSGFRFTFNFIQVGTNCEILGVAWVRDGKGMNTPSLTEYMAHSKNPIGGDVTKSALSALTSILAEIK
jgi:hypothetical protein